MEFPFDILDSIFGFLRSHPESLIACSKAHPVFSQAVERHLYYHIRFLTRLGNKAGRIDTIGYSLEPSFLIKLLRKTPHIVNYIRILQIDFNYSLHLGRSTLAFQKIALVLPMFSMLECMILGDPYYIIPWKHLPQGFKTAVENCLHLSTLQSVHVGHLNLPHPILNKHVNITCFSLSGSPRIDHTDTQLTALSFDDIAHDPDLTFFTTWSKRHTVNLRSLKYDYSNDEILSELLEICSDTLNSLDLQITKTAYETTHYYFGPPRDGPTPLINLSSFPHLQHLTIRGRVSYVAYVSLDYSYVSQLPAVVEIFKTAPLLRHLTIDITVEDDGVDKFDFYSKVHFPFFKALAESAASFGHIDLYIHGISKAWIVSLFGEYDGVMALIERGVLVIHLTEAPLGDYLFVE